MGCCCEWRAPRQLRYAPPAIVFAIIAYLYASFTRFAQPRLVSAGVHWAELLSFHAMTALLCTSLARCMLSTDSFVVKNTLPRKQKPAGSDTSEEKQLDGEGSSDGAQTASGSASSAVVPSAAALLGGTPPMIESKMNGEVRYCRKCSAVKPDRAHHCSTCRRCVLKMDHHCVYINKCIGFYNYKFFLLFLGWSSLTCLYQSSLLFRYLLGDALDHAAKLYFFGKLRFLSPSLQVVLVFFFGFCLGAALLCFYAMHLYFTARNHTTIEYCEKRDDPYYVNFFDLGVLRNIQQVFGTFRELPYWFVPVQSPSALRSQGQFFPVNSKFVKED